MRESCVSTGRVHRYLFIVLCQGKLVEDWRGGEREGKREKERERRDLIRGNGRLKLLFPTTSASIPVIGPERRRYRDGKLNTGLVARPIAIYQVIPSPLCNWTNTLTHSARSVLPIHSRSRSGGKGNTGRGRFSRKRHNGFVLPH